VPITVSDLQEMQNHMRETIDQGMANTRRRQKRLRQLHRRLRASTPPPDTNAAREIEQQQKIAAAEG
jgi:hypothetical protein